MARDRKPPDDQVDGRRRQKVSVQRDWKGEEGGGGGGGGV